MSNVLEDRKSEKFSRNAAPGSSARRSRIIRLYLTAGILLSLMFTMYIWQTTKIIEVKLRIKKAAEHLDHLESSNAVQRAEISKLQALSRIEEVAKKELGMVVPQKMCYIPVPQEFWK